MPLGHGEKRGQRSEFRGDLSAFLGVLGALGGLSFQCELLTFVNETDGPLAILSLR